MQIVVCILDECIALSLSEIASRYPTAAGPYYWSFQLANSRKELLSFITGWIWLMLVHLAPHIIARKLMPNNVL